MILDLFDVREFRAYSSTDPLLKGILLWEMCPGKWVCSSKSGDMEAEGSTPDQAVLGHIRQQLKAAEERLEVVRDGCIDLHDQWTTGGLP